MTLAPYQPVNIKNKKELTKLLKKNPQSKIVDVLERQILELFFIDNHKYVGFPKEKIYQESLFKKYQQLKKKEYQLFYYPWNYTLVKCLRANDYFRLRTNRNQDLITFKEQQILYRFKIAVFGLSVGSNIALTLTQAGISQNIILADPDELDTTNLNRILAGIHEVGLNKSIISARKIYEENPYAGIKIFTEGINNENLAVLLQNKEIDCIIEEVDNLPVKIDIRLLAKKFKVPVLMITDNGDGVVLTIERYDLGYQKIFNQALSYWQNRLSAPLTRELAGDIIINDLVGGKNKVAPKMLKSVKKVYRHQLVSWSQLGSAAILGGVAVTIAVKKIVLNSDHQKYQRLYINLPL